MRCELFVKMIIEGDTGTAQRIAHKKGAPRDTPCIKMYKNVK